MRSIHISHQPAWASVRTGAPAVLVLAALASGTHASGGEDHRTWIETPLANHGSVFQLPESLEYWETGPPGHRDGIRIAEPNLSLPTTLDVGFKPGKTAVQIFERANDHCSDCMARWEALPGFPLDSLGTEGKIARAEHGEFFWVFADGLCFTYCRMHGDVLDEKLAFEIIRSFRLLSPKETGQRSPGLVRD